MPEATELETLARILAVRDESIARRTIAFSVLTRDAERPAWAVKYEGVEHRDGDRHRLDLANHLGGTDDTYAWDGESLVRRQRDRETGKALFVRSTSHRDFFREGCLPDQFGTAILGMSVPALFKTYPCVVEGRESIGSAQTLRIQAQQRSRRDPAASLPYIRIWLDETTLLLQRAVVYRELDSGLDGEQEAPPSVEAMVSYELEETFALGPAVYPAAFVLRAESADARAGYESRTRIDQERCSLELPGDVEFTLVEAAGELSIDCFTGEARIAGSQTQEGIGHAQLDALCRGLGLSSVSAAAEPAFYEINCADLAVHLLLRLEGATPALEGLTAGEEAHDRTVQGIIAALDAHGVSARPERATWDSVLSRGRPSIGLLENSRTEAAHFAVLQPVSGALLVAGPGGLGRIASEEEFHRRIGESIVVIPASSSHGWSRAVLFGAALAALIAFAVDRLRTRSA